MVNTRLEITQNISGRDLEIFYKKEKDPKVKERLLMIIHAKEGWVTREVAKAVKMSYGIVAYWIHRFNKEGIDGLKNKPKSGRPAKLEKDGFKALWNDIRKPPAEHGYNQQFWSTKLLRIHIREKYGKEYTQRHVQRLFHRLGFSLIKPRPRHIKADKAEEIEFKQSFKKNWKGLTKTGSC